MFPLQIPTTASEEFSRCDERIQQSDPAKDLDPTQRSDVATTRSVERAIWNDDVLRSIEYYEVDVHTKNGIVHLNGHIANTSSRIRIENVIRLISGILGVRNRLVLDEKPVRIPWVREGHHSPHRDGHPLLRFRLLQFANLTNGAQRLLGQTQAGDYSKAEEEQQSAQAALILGGPRRGQAESSRPKTVL